MKKISTLLFAALLTSQIKAQTFVRWDFDYGSDATTSTGTINPSLGTGTVTLIGGTTSTFVAGYPNSANDNSALNTSTYAAQGAENLDRGIQFSVSTVGKTGIVISYAEYHSNTSSKYTKLQYTTDGTTWNTVDLTTANTTGSTGSIDTTNDLFVIDAGSTWYLRIIDLTSVTAVNNAANFAFRIVSAFDPSTGTSYTPVGSSSNYGTSGTMRYDAVQVGNNSTLPIHLSYFTASLNKDNKVNLLWKTETESGISNFVIERSTNGTNFENINSVEATGKESGDAYNYTDDWSYDGTLYYRLKIMYDDNTSEFGPVARIDIKKVKTDAFTLYPSPATNEITVRFSKMEDGDILIYDYTGKNVFQTQMNGNESSKTIDVSNFQKGAYFIIYQGANGATTERFLKI